MEWANVNDKLPNDSNPKICCAEVADKFFGPFIAYFSGGCWWSYSNLNGSPVTVTHYYDIEPLPKNISSNPKAMCNCS